MIILGMSVNVLFGLLGLIDALNIRFYYLYSPQVINIAFFSPTTDFWIWWGSLLFTTSETLLRAILRDRDIRSTLLLSILTSASLSAFLIYGRTAYLLAAPLGFIAVALSIHQRDGYLVTTKQEAASLTLLCTISPLIIIEALSASSWTLNMFDYESPLTLTPRWIFSRVDLQLFNVLYPSTSWLLLLFLYSWIWIPALKHTLSRVTLLKRLSLRIDRNTVSHSQNAGSKFMLNNKHVALGLILSLTAVAFITCYPYAHAPTSSLVGSDSLDYYNLLREMAQKGPLTAFQKDRPFAALLMYLIQHASGSSPDAVVRIMPAILAVCLGLAVFWLVKVGTKNVREALMSSLFSSFSFQTTVGLFSYFIANWLAIIESLVLLAFLLQSLEKRSWKHLSASAFIGMTVLLTHPYTWDALMAVLAFYLMWTFLGRKPDRKSEVTLVAFLLASNLAFYGFYSLAPFGKGLSSAEGTALHNVASSISVSNLLNLQGNLNSMVQAWVGGLFGNPLLILLAIAGVLSMFNFTKKFNRVMLLWIIVPSLTLLAVSPDPYYYRLTYLIPIQIQAAAGLHWALSKLEHLKAFSKPGSLLLRVVSVSIITLAVLLMLNYALRSADEAVVNML